MVRHPGKPDGAQQDGIGAGDLRHAVLRHHAAGLVIALARPVMLGPFKAEAVSLRDRLQDADPFRHDLLADAVAGDQGDAIGAFLRHGPSLCLDEIHMAMFKP